MKFLSNKICLLIILLFFKLNVIFGNDCLFKAANVIANDAGISALVSPSISGCYTSSETVVVTIQNFGTNVITNIPVNVIVSGPINQSITATYTNNLAVGATTNFTVGFVNMSFGGVYTFSAYTIYPGDANPGNDFILTSRTVSPFVNIIAPAAICLGSSATLTVSGAANYTWNTGSNSTSIVISPTITTTYSVIGTNTAGCSAISIKTISVQNPTISANGASGCGNPATGTLTASAFSPAIVSWYATPISTIVLGTGNNYTLSSGITTTLYAEAHSTTAGSLFTTLAGGNNANGNMFDVTAVNALTITGLDWHFNSNTTSTVEVWYRAGSFVGFENSNAGWILALTSTVTPLGTGTLSSVPGNFSIAIGAGQTFGIYVTVNGGSGINYTNGTGLGNLYSSSADLQLFEGKGGAYFNVNLSPRIFNGQLKYSKADCSSPRVPAIFSTISGVTVTALASYSSVCSGKSATLNGNGATNYTWSPAGTIAPGPFNATIVASPTINTTYTVLGSIAGCPSVSSFTINLSITPSPTLSITPSQTINPGSIITLTTGGAFTYSWSPGGSNNTNILINPSVTTVYTVTGTNNYSCTASITTTVTIGNVGLEKFSINDNQLLLFPNPNNGIITIISEKNDVNYLFEIFDLRGKLIFSAPQNKQESTFDVRNISNGIYSFKISALTDKTILKQGKLVKQ